MPIIPDDIPPSITGLLYHSRGEILVTVAPGRLYFLSSQRPAEIFNRHSSGIPGGCVRPESRKSKAELIELVTYISSPISALQYVGPHFDLIGWLSLYKMMTPSLKGYDNSSTRLDLDNMPQPDVCLTILPSHGGQDKIGERGYIEGAPELVAEVACSSVSDDLHVKLNVYRRNGVREHVVWRVLDRTIDWFILQAGEYERLPFGPDGLYRSEVFPRLWLDPAALIGGDSMRVAEVARRGLESPEHAAFVARLRERVEAGQKGREAAGA